MDYDDIIETALSHAEMIVHDDWLAVRYMTDAQMSRYVVRVGDVYGDEASDAGIVYRVALAMALEPAIEAMRCARCDDTGIARGYVGDAEWADVCDCAASRGIDMEGVAWI